MQQIDPGKWAAAAAELMRAASPTLLHEETSGIEFTGALQGMPALKVAPWNRVWLKSSAQELAVAQVDPEHPPLAATWHFGDGAVLATGFDCSPQVAASLIKLIARSPRDPRFHVTWNTGPTLRLSVDAVDGERYLNGESISLSLQEQTPGAGTPTAYSVPLAGPGRYELSITAPRTASIATIRAVRMP